MMARPQGFEPRFPGPEPGVLPLHHGRIMWTLQHNLYQFTPIYIGVNGYHN